MSYDPIFSVLLVEGDYKYVVVGRESGAVEKYRLGDLKGKPVLTLKNAHKGTVTTITLAPNGNADEIYTGSLDKSISHWTMTDDSEQLEGEYGNKRLIKSTLTTTGIRCGVVMPDIQLLCFGGSDGNLHVIREDTHTPERWVSGHSDAISSIAQTQTENGDALLASGSYDGMIRIWNAASGVPLYLLSGHTSQVKGVQFIPSNDGGQIGVMGVGRDEKARLWLLPLEINVEGGGANSNGDDAEEEEHEGEEGAARRRGSSAQGGIKRIDCCAVIGLPAAPLCIATQPESETPLIAVGLSGGDLVTFKAHKFLSAVTSYTKINATEVKREKKRLETLLKTEERREKLTTRKSIRRKEKELIDAQKKEEQDAKTKAREERQALRQVRSDAGEDGGDEEGEEEEEEEEQHFEDDHEEEDEEFDEEDGEGARYQLTAERQTELDEFKEKIMKESNERLKTLRTSVGDRKRLLAPIGVKKYEREASQFADIAFTRHHHRAVADSIAAVQLSGTKAILGFGDRIAVVDSTPGVQMI